MDNGKNSDSLLHTRCAIVYEEKLVKIIKPMQYWHKYKDVPWLMYYIGNSCGT